MSSGLPRVPGGESERTPFGLDTDFATAAVIHSTYIIGRTRRGTGVGKRVRASEAFVERLALTASMWNRFDDICLTATG